MVMEEESSIQDFEMDIKNDNLFELNNFCQKHCSHCINILTCMKGSESKLCEIIKCHLNCGFKFHKCKLEEHELMCPLKKVACINANFGCPLRITREKLGSHLEICPASIVVCTMEWNRRPFFQTKSLQVAPKLFRNGKPEQEQLDVSLALQDQRLLNKSKKTSKLKNSSTQSSTSFNMKGIIVEWNCSGSPVGNNSFNEVFNHEKESDLSFKLPSEKEQFSKDPSVDFPEWITYKSPCNILDYQACVAKAEESMPSPPALPDKNVSLELDLTVERIVKYESKARWFHTFMCNKMLRRDEYPWHFKNVHTEIYSGVNGWLETRCPLYIYGCTYSQRKFDPTERGALVVHHELVESCGVRPSVPKHLENSREVSPGSGNSYESFCNLPDLVLQSICKHLDSFSLANLSLTCHHLRDFCSTMLKSRGLVINQWKQAESGSKRKWEEAPLKWCFSSSFTPVERWIHSDKCPMSEHLKTCQYLHRVTPDKPFSYIFGGLDKARGSMLL